jgi:rare lipoprotein A
MTKRRYAYALAACFAANASAVPKAEAGPCDIKKTVGMASFYGPGLNGNLTANEEKFNMNGKENTAAHPTLPFDSIVRATDLKTGKHIDVRINDRGPFVGGRILDFQMATAFRLGLTKKRGVTKVQLAVLRCGD